MKSIVTNWDLIRLRDDIQIQVNASTAFHVFNKEKIKRFYEQNQIHLEVIASHIKRLVKTHVEHDELGEPIVVDGKYQFTKPEDEKNYLSAYNELMSRNCTMYT